MTIRTYTQFSRLDSFAARFRYLKLGGTVGRETFGEDRHLNQMFYRSREWKELRNAIIVRDGGCDLGVPGYEIHTELYIHHINPMRVDDIVTRNPDNLNPEFLVTTTLKTHNAIHYGDETILLVQTIDRTAGDTRLW